MAYCEFIHSHFMPGEPETAFVLHGLAGFNPQARIKHQQSIIAIAIVEFQ
jgi:hypothetical protein